MNENYGDDDELSLVDSQDGLGSSAGYSPRVDIHPHRDSNLDEDSFESDQLNRGVGRSNSNSNSHHPPNAAGAASLFNSGSFRTFLLSAALAEFVASFFLVYLGISAIYAANLVGDDALSTGSILMVAIGYGFAYGCLVYCFSLNGGGYVPSIRQLNPSLTFSLFLLGKIDMVKAIVLCVAQIGGAIFGTGILFLCFGGHSLRVYELFDGTNFWQQLFMSIFVSFLFFFVLLITNFTIAQPTLQQGVSTDTSEQAPQTVHELNCLITSLVCVIGTAVGTPITGCFMNPIFGLTVSSLSHWYNNVIVMVLGPTFGSLLASLTAKLFTYRTRQPFLTGVRWGQGGLGGLGLGNIQPQSMPTISQLHQQRQNPFNPNRGEEKSFAGPGSRF